MSGVVTIYCCGTGKHRDMGDYLIGNLYRLDQAPEQSNVECGMKYVLDGPGASGHDIFKSKEIVNKVNKGDTSGYEFGKKRGYSFLNKITGDGWADNVYEVQQWLMLVDAKLKKTSAAGIKTVNLIGHSRGAVTCIMIAHMMMMIDRTWKANIVALDPVPGSDASGFTKENLGNLFQLPANVTNYLAMLMEHVDSKGFNVRFQPVYLEKMNFNVASNLSFRQLPLPGKHGDLVKYQLDSYPVWKISASNSIDFLTRNGTVFGQNPTLLLTDAELLEQYAEVHLARMDAGDSKDAKTESKSMFRRLNIVRWGIGKEWLNDRGKQVENPVREHPYYLNLQHAALFQACCPNIVRALDNQQTSTSDSILVPHYFQSYPLSIQLLWKLHLVSDAHLAAFVYQALQQYRDQTSGFFGKKFTSSSTESLSAISALTNLISSKTVFPIDNVVAPTVHYLTGGAPLAKTLASQAHLAPLVRLKSGGRLDLLLKEALKKWEAVKPIHI